ncbi:MAG TPA: ATP-binding cassette domain-containing protein [Longimicrobiales bacterium]|nr:ATP-binding cassette domain-containing protein [Longimicrobiales bacterium]
MDERPPAPDEHVLRGAIRDEIALDAGTTPVAGTGEERVVELEDVRLAFDHQEILKGLSLHVSRGETLLVLGESGIGKSTVLKLILRLLLPQSGHIRVFGQEITELPFDAALDLRRRMGMVFQNAALFDSVNVYDNVAYPLRENTRMTEGEIEQVVRERLDFVDLDPDSVGPKLPGELSGGMKKRVGLARAIATDPQLVLYDEPTAGLDPLTVGTIGDLIRKLQRERDVTSIVVTHDIRAGFRVASRVNLLRDGVVAFDGAPEEMIAEDDPYIQRFLALS